MPDATTLITIALSFILAVAVVATLVRLERRSGLLVARYWDRLADRALRVYYGNKTPFKGSRKDRARV